MIITQRKRFRALATHLRENKPLNVEVVDYLANAFEKIGAGASADEVFNLKYNRGQKVRDEDFKNNLIKIFPLIATYMSKDSGYGLNASQAISAVSAMSYGNEWTHPKTKEVIPAMSKGLLLPITEENLKKAWSSPEYAQIKSECYSNEDWFFPF